MTSKNKITYAHRYDISVHLLHWAVSQQTLPCTPPPPNCEGWVNS